MPAVESIRDRLAALCDTELDRPLATVGNRCASTEQAVNGNGRPPGFSVGVAAASGGLRFHVLRPHAKGGLGAIFIARDQELNREVALKQILDNHADDEDSRLVS